MQADEQTLDDLKAAIEKVRVETKTPAVGIALADHNGIQWVDGLGEANLETHAKADENTLFRIGSVSKMFVALAALKLIQEGKLSLDSNLADLAPEIYFQNPWESKNPIKIVHLLEHTTGWDNTHPKELTLAVNAETPLLDLLNFHPYSRKSRWQPGTRMAYNNTGPVVIAYLIEKITKQSFQDYIRDQLLTPLELGSTQYFPTINSTTNYAIPSLHGTKTEFVYDVSWPSGALVSSPHDMALLLQFFIQKKVDLLSIDQGLMIRMELPTSTLGAKQGMATGYGLGNYTSTHFDYPYVFHGHRGTVSGSLTEFFYSRQLNAGYVFMMNDMNAAYFKISNLIRNYLINHYSSASDESIVNSSIAKPLDNFSQNNIEGMYIPVSSSSTYANFGEQLFSPIKITKNNNLLRLQPVLGGAITSHEWKSHNLFVNSKTRLDAMAIVDDPIDRDLLEINSHTGNVTYKKVSPFRVYSQIVVIVVIMATTLGCLLLILLVGLFNLIKPSAKISLATNFLALLSSILLILYYYLSSQMAYNLQAFGKPGVLSIGLLLVSVAWPLMISYSLYRNIYLLKINKNLISKVMFLNSLLLLVSELILCVVMASYGLIGIPTWL